MRRIGIFGLVVGMALACGGGEEPVVVAPPVEPVAPPPSKVGEVIGTVAWFETNGPSCQWQVREFQTRVAPAVEPVAARTLGVFDVPCPDGGGVSFFVNTAADKAIVWWGGDAETLAWSVDLASGAAVRLPSLKYATSFGFAADGSVQGFSVDSSESIVEGWAKVFHFEGKEYPSDVSDGLPALAVAWKLEAVQWKSNEVKVTSTGWDYAADEQQLDAYKLSAGVRSADALERFNGDGSQNAADEALAKKLTALGPIPPDFIDGEWQVVTQDNKSVAWHAFAAEFLVPSAPVYWDRGEGWQALPDSPYKIGDNLHFAWKGRLLMLSNYGFAPKFWDVQSGVHIADAPKAGTAVFWPPTEPKRSRGE